MKFVIIAALVAVALCQTRVVEAAPAWNGWNGAYNGWNGAWNGRNGWNGATAWPAVTETVLESPHWWNDNWGNWDNQWNGWNPTWGWNPAWGTRPATWGYGDWNWNTNAAWGRPTVATTAGARVVYP